MQKCDGSFSKPNSDKFSHTAQFYFSYSSVSEFLQSRGGLEPKYNQYIGMAHSLCSGVRSDMQRAWIIDLNSLLVSLLKVDKSVRLVKLVSVHFFHI